MTKHLMKKTLMERLNFPAYIANEPCPCDNCYKQDWCKTECAVFKLYCNGLEWEEDAKRILIDLTKIQPSNILDNPQIIEIIRLQMGIPANKFYQRIKSNPETYKNLIKGEIKDERFMVKKVVEIWEMLQEWIKKEKGESNG